MKRSKRLTKRERKALKPKPQQAATGPAHIHCVACGRHIDPSEFEMPPITATWLTCDHGSRFASCVSCAVQGQTLLDTHDRTGQPVRAANAWH